ncbi:hybrid sensor histidine kinase/response regulator [Marinilabilia rubra]|uniref:histidine kinase n=1 Tax=Marinilabilia rubra TaxID=2162893 RepID=A0A2U2B3K0_9BACT|nr:hybrid sensor histidine kinase/response regulator [Marinilabilia rubra]PWD97624.1 hypothetical protein DDZ16_19750 [Marinilabilia rubra]
MLLTKKKAAMYRHLNILFLLLIFCSELILANEKIKLKPLESELFQSLVRDIHRDHEGYLWIANNGVGLMKYNSHFITRYLHNKSDTTSMSDDGVMVIEQDSMKNLWFGTINGLNRYCTYQDNFERYFSIPGDTTSLSSNFVNEMYLDTRGTLWVLTAHGLCQYLPEKNHFKRFYIPDSPSANNFTGMDQDSKGNYWVVTTSNGIYKFNPDSNLFIHYPDNKTISERLFSKKILIDTKDRFWIANWGAGLASFNPEAGDYFYYPVTDDGSGTNRNLAMNIIEWGNDQLLIAVDQGGINKLDLKTNIFTYIKANDPAYGQMLSNGVYCFHHDQEGILWVGTSRGGTFYSNPKENIFDIYSTYGGSMAVKDGIYNMPIHNIITSFYEDAKGDIWVGTGGGGIASFNQQERKFIFHTHNPQNENSLSSNVIRTITGDHNGNLLVATWDGGINKMNPQTGMFTKEPFERKLDGGYHGRNLWNIDTDSKNRIWITNPVGQIDLYDENKNLLGQFFIEPNPEIYHLPLIYEDEKNRIYTNTVRGVFLFNESGRYFEQVIKLPEVTFINLDDPKHIWAGTQKDGLYLCSRNGQILKQYTTEDGLSDNYVCSIIMDSERNLWISTHNGLSYLKTKAEQFTNYTEKDALAGNHFYIQSSLKTSNGKIFFGGADGFISFFPKDIPENKTRPEIYLTDFYVNNKKMDFKEEKSPISKPVKYIKNVNLKYNQRILTFHFQSINYTFPHKSQYKYILEGYENEWHVQNTEVTSANYTNLDPGTYTFKVTASNSDGLWSKKPATMEILIRPPVWKTRLFLVALTVIIIASLVLLLKWRNRKLIREKNRLQKKVSERTKVIEEQAHELSNQNRILEDQKEELEIQRDELAKHEEILEQEVRERTRDLKIAKDKAEKSDKLKSYFLANMSHEIRTPMNAIVGFATLLNEEGTSPEEKSEFIKLIKDNSDNLRFLVEDILDFSLIEANQMKIHYNNFLLNEFINHIYSSFALRNENPNVELRKKNLLEKEDLSFISDEFRIRQILSNLLSNAIKFTEHGFVELIIDRKASEIVFSVTDTGPGISESEQKIIFNQFVKLENDQFMAKRGIGLGLTLSQRLSKMLGAKLSVESELGKGSTFSLSFPFNVTMSRRTYPPKKPTTFLRKNWSYKNLLVIEDEISNYHFIFEVLKGTEINITWAKDGFEALEFLHNSKKFDLVLLDIKLPKMDGFKTFQRIRELVPEQIIIAQTAYARPEDELKIRESGFDEYLAKPINPHHLLKILSQFLDNN